MPTAYTAAIYEGLNPTFPEFAMKCARAFGICQNMRDERLDVPIPDKFEVSDYHLKDLAEAKEELVKVLAMSEDDKIRDAHHWNVRCEEEYTSSLERHHKLKSDYMAMLNCVEAWTPPSADHDELKKYMIQQLEDGIEHDCRLPEKMKTISSSELYTLKLKWARDDVKYHNDEHVKEVKKVRDGNYWLAELRESLQCTTKA